MNSEDTACYSIILIIALLFAFSQMAYACLGDIDPALGANPSYFNMSDEANREIYRQNISAEMKFYLLIHNAFGSSPLLPKIREYNLLLPFSCPPNESEVRDGGFIRDAWVQVISINPSVLDGREWAPSKGEVLTRYNYSVKLPASATNSYPNCGAVYTLLSSAHNLSIFVNGREVGNSELARYETNSTDLNVEAELLISVSVREDSYAAECICCGEGEEGCAMCCSCEFAGSRVIDEQMKLNSSARRAVYGLNSTTQLTLLRCPSTPFTTGEGNLSVNFSSPIQSLLLSLGEGNASVRMRELDVMPVMKPHNALEAIALHSQHELSERMLSRAAVSENSLLMNFSGFSGEVRNASVLVVDLFGERHFYELNLSCPLNPTVELLLPKLVEEGSEFKAVARVTYKGKGVGGRRVVLSYSGERLSGVTNSEGEASFTLKANQSIVEAYTEYDGVFASASARGNVGVYNPSEFSYLLSLLAFLFILVISYIGLRRVVG